MNSILKLAFGLFLAIGWAGLAATPSQAAEGVVVVQGRHTDVVRIRQPRQRLGQPLAEPRPVWHLAYFPRTYRGVAYVRGPYARRRAYVHRHTYVHTRRYAHIRKYRHAPRRWIRHAATCPVVNRFGIVVAFARGC